MWSRTTVTFKVTQQRGDVLERLSAVVSSSPFEFDRLESVDATTWVLYLSPASSQVVLSFTKFAELLVLLSKEVDIVAFDRAAASEMAAAS